MSSYLQQTVAREQIHDQIAASEQGRVRRQFRDARRAARAARRDARAARRDARLASRGEENTGQHWAHQVGYAGA